MKRSKSILIWMCLAGSATLLGAQELFTFDNHAPRGGCVLLNDGTVKFIRTKEEFHQLRWK